MLALCAGLSFANVARTNLRVAFFATLVTLVAASRLGRTLVLAVALIVAGWWWGSMRLGAIDYSVLAPRVGTAQSVRVVVTNQPRRTRFDVRAQAVVLRFGSIRPREPVLLRMPVARPPPQGAILAGLGELLTPPGPKNGFDERTWLRRHGVHVVLRLDVWRVVGHRGGLGGFADHIRRWLRGSVARGVHGERAAVLEGIVLGDDSGLSDALRQRFRASGLYHLLAVSGQNVALVAAGALALAWLLGLSRRLGEIGALAAIAAYVLAVGPQPSVIRAGIAGALTSLAWLTARLTDRWHLLLVAALVLLAWSPYILLDAGFQLSFAAVAAIFVLVPRFLRRLAGYPLPGMLAEAIAVSAACGLATAPVMWLQFHAIPLLSIPANALAAPAMVPLLGLALTGAVLAPVVPSAAAALAWINGWLAAYLATVARMIGGLPGAQITSTRTLLVICAGALLLAAYAVPRWQASSTPST